MMDEDIEFRDMVLKKLEQNGSLLDIKAKLRAYLYDVIENEGKHVEIVNDSDLTYNGESSMLAEDDPEEDNHTLALSVVFDLLDCLKLSYTKRVLATECGIKKISPRDHLEKKILGRSSSGGDEEGSGEPKEAILYRMIADCRKTSTSDLSQVSREATEIDESCTP
ncbi:uncharacterized protein LOC129777477 [Toxorhynchites rutilus septentrionalis]|uniref:uncharacterized protein LOC129777477 n=1 Tax=Toxorhynchites rutilus septentrionalis TaxID=329112 RepID=UPI0024789152|nr:uncharacterized protein LOC129777477 [Toxorhynchites rutilus septentrionalis]